MDGWMDDILNTKHPSITHKTQDIGFRLPPLWLYPNPDLRKPRNKTWQAMHSNNQRWES